MDNWERAQKIKMILMDVDGTLTDGTLMLMPDGAELKGYHVRDGMGILMAHLAGFKTGIITGKTSTALEIRAKKLKIMEVFQGVLDKNKIYTQILDKHGLKKDEIAYIGDDLGDLPVIKNVGLSAAVADAHPLIKQHSHMVCKLPGGRGAVREFIEFIFDAQDTWSRIEDKLNDLTGAKIE